MLTLLYNARSTGVKQFEIKVRAGSPIRGFDKIAFGCWGKMTSRIIDINVVGAGPYGLSIAAHLGGSRHRLPHLRQADDKVAQLHA